MKTVRQGDKQIETDKQTKRWIDRQEEKAMYTILKKAELRKKRND